MASSYYTGIPTCWYDVNNITQPNTYVVPCGLNSTENPYVTCCWPGDRCLSNNLCYYDHKQETGSGYYQASCTDPTLKDPTCSSQCAAQGYSDVVWNVDNLQWQCCIEGDCQNFSSNVTWDAPSPVDLTTLTSLPASAAYIDAYLTASDIGTFSASATTTSSSISSQTTTTASSSTPTSASSSAAPTSTTLASGAGSTSSNSSSSGGLSAGAAAGIAVGATLGGLLVLGLLGWFIWSNRRQKQRRNQHSTTELLDQRGTFSPINSYPDSSSPTKSMSQREIERSQYIIPQRFAPYEVAADETLPEVDGQGNELRAELMTPKR